MKFADIIGHKEEIQKLVSMVDGGRLPHALLLHGPSGIGKTLVARALVQYINCTNRSDGDSCGKCPSCLQTSKLNNPDIHYVFPIVKRQSEGKILSSDYGKEWEEFISKFPFMPLNKWLEIIEAGNSRPMIYVNESEELLRESSLSPYGSTHKIFFIWQPEKMNPEAANKLLKVIEEPYEDTLFIMVSNSPGDIISTIRSRLQGIEFLQLSDEDISRFLISNGKNEEQAISLCRLAKGNLNRASVLLDTEGELSTFTHLFIDVMRAAYARKLEDLKSFADTFASFGREKSLRLLDYFSRMVRESFISNLRLPSLLAMTEEEATFVAKFGRFINANNVEEICAQINRASEDISRNANQKIVWFDFFLELTRLIRTKN